MLRALRGKMTYGTKSLGRIGAAMEISSSVSSGQQSPAQTATAMPDAAAGQRVGFIGLGIMGDGMARRLLLNKDTQLVLCWLLLLQCSCA